MKTSSMMPPMDAASFAKSRPLAMRPMAIMMPAIAKIL